MGKGKRKNRGDDGCGGDKEGEEVGIFPFILTDLIFRNDISNNVIDSQVAMPRKALYRQRAHSNPLLDAHFDVPLSPNHVKW